MSKIVEILDTVFRQEVLGCRNISVPTRTTISPTLFNILQLAVSIQCQGFGQFPTHFYRILTDGSVLSILFQTIVIYYA